MSNTPPIVIIGGGLAGSAAAIHLARAGHSPLLIERHSGPVHKVCGEFVSPGAVAELTALGVHFDHFGASRITRLRLIDGARIAEARLPFEARGLSRFRLDEALLQRASAAGAVLRRGVAVRSLDGNVLRLDTGETVRADTLFLATGKHELRGAKRDSGDAPMIGFKMHYRPNPAMTAALCGRIDIILFPGGYVGLQLIENDIANLCLVVERGCYTAAGGDWTGLIGMIVARTPLLRGLLRDAEAMFALPLAIANIPYGYRHRDRKAAAPPQPFRLGDQAAVIPSFCGDGMAIALHSARLAAETWLSGGSPAAYHRHLAAALSRQFKAAALLSRLAANTPGRAMLLGAGRLFPATLGVAARVTRLNPIV